MRLKSPHYELYSTYEGPKFYEVLDRVIDVMALEIRKQKDKEIGDRKTRGRHDEFKKQR
jgi:hypothetical protein